MKLKQIGMISHFPIWEFINFPSPLVFIKIGDRQIDLVSAKRINGKFFHTKLGLFELDGEYENTMMGQPFYIFNLQNGKPISLRHVEKLQRLYKENKTEELGEILNTISKEIEKGMMIKNFDEKGNEEPQYSTPLDALKEIVSKKPQFLTDDDIKFMIDYRYTNLNDLKIFNFKKISEAKPDSDLSKKIPTMIPMVIVSLIGIAAILVTAFSGIGGLLRSIGDPRPQLLLGLKQGVLDFTTMVTGIFT